MSQLLDSEHQDQIVAAVRDTLEGIRVTACAAIRGVGNKAEYEIGNALKSQYGNSFVKLFFEAVQGDVKASLARITERDGLLERLGRRV